LSSATGGTSKLRPLLPLALVAVGGILAFLGLSVIAIEGRIAAQASECGASASSGPASAGGIPSRLLPIYDQAASRYGLGPSGWAYLASINAEETNFGQNLAVSSTGAEGWMQFEPGTWAKYGVSADPSKLGDRPDPYDPWDAIFAAANYLRASGAPGNWSRALFTYGGNADWYVTQVIARAQRYMNGDAGGSSAPSAQPVSLEAADCAAQNVPTTPGITAKILPDGEAEAPAGAPPQVKDAIAAGDEIIHTFYSQERRANMLTKVQDSYDCSGSTDFVLYNAGLSSPQVDVGNGVAGDSTALESYGLPGPDPSGWINVFASSGHAFIEVAGIVLDTAWYSSAVPINPQTVPDPYPGDDPQNGGPHSGPRWQPASIISAQRSDGNQWSERHPGGL
jgi:hypothetical protein